MKRELSLNLLNSEELESTRGGKPGDIIFKECLIVAKVIIKSCATYEASCPTSITGCLSEGFTCIGGVVLTEQKLTHHA